MPRIALPSSAKAITHAGCAGTRSPGANRSVTTNTPKPTTMPRTMAPATYAAKSPPGDNGASSTNTRFPVILDWISDELEFVLLAPLSPGGLFAAYVAGAMVRGIVVGLGVFVVTLMFAPGLLVPAHPAWVIAFALLGSAILGTLGLIAGIWADKFDQLAAFQNFIIVPLTFLSGVFYSIHSLPPVWQVASHFNPFFYMIDGFRYGFFGLADVAPEASLAVVGGFACLLAAVALALIGRGWKLRP